MSGDVYAFEVSEGNFAETVVQNSHQLPVVAVFLGMWSEHCMLQDQIFTQLATEHAGRFIFAKVDIDMNPELRKEYQVETVPTTIVFRNGVAERTELGVLEMDEARALLKDYGISFPADDLRHEARAKHIAGDTPAAIVLLTQAIQLDPRNTRVAMDMVQIFLDIGQLDNARGLFARLPERDQNSELGKQLLGQINIIGLALKTAGIDALQAQLAADADDAQARFDLAVCLMAQHDYQQAMDHLLHVVQHRPDFRDGAAREMMVAVLQLLGGSQPELAREYQKQLSNVLAS